MSYTHGRRGAPPWEFDERPVRMLAARKRRVLLERGEDVEDLVQEVSLQMARKVEVVRHPTALACKIARNALVDRQRRPVPPTVEVEPASIPLAEPLSIVDEVLERETRQERLRRIELAIREPLEQRVLRGYIEDKTRAQIAAEQKITVTDVKRILDRVKDRVGRQRSGTGLDPAVIPPFRLTVPLAPAPPARE